MNRRPLEANPPSTDLATASCRETDRAEMVAGTVAAAGEATVQRDSNTEVERYCSQFIQLLHCHLTGESDSK